LRVNLPSASRLSLKVWSLQGKQLEAASMDLPEGSYRLVRDQDAGVNPPECTCFRWNGSAAESPGRFDP